MRTAIVAMLIAVIALLWLNPSMDDFSTFVEARSEQILMRETGDSALGRALSGLGSSLAGSYVDRITEQNNYFLFSTYTIDLDGADAERNDWRFLGIAGRFIELERPERMRENAR